MIAIAGSEKCVWSGGLVDCSELSSLRDRESSRVSNHDHRMRIFLDRIPSVSAMTSVGGVAKVSRPVGQKTVAHDTILLTCALIPRH